MSSRFLTVVLLGTLLSGCVMFREPVETTAPPPVPRAPATTAGSVASPYAAPPASAVPAPPVTAPPAATRQFHLGAAATALVTQAHRQAAAGEQQLAISSIERALGIEPDKPLLGTR